MFLNIASKSLDAFSIAENKKTIQSKHISEYLKKSTMPQDMFVGTSSCENVGVSDDKKSSILSHYKKESKLQKVVENWLCSSNKATDEKDDGKLGFFSKVGNILEGIGKAAVGTVYNVLTNPARLARTVGVGLGLAILAANPVTAIGVAALGAVTAVHLVVVGVGTISDSIKEAENAENDAAAKDAYEKMGQGILEVGAGVSSGVAAGKLVTTSIPKLPTAFSNMKTGFTSFCKNPIQFFKSMKMPEIKISKDEMDKVVLESVLDICNIEDDL